ncbi:hypothetical protein [Streptosporangium roseum]|uniref:hypothetical protein n=1 Tax=Streptosporangium roseum TaxID=2001 RepID=UPI0001A3D833|nr:hypothetical protein [Streptosporangium roseum]
MTARSSWPTRTWQPADLADRLTAAADTLRISKNSVEWIVGLLVGVAGAAAIAVALAPHLLTS